MRPILVDTTNFPLYAVNVISENEFIVAGGGGASKTGVPNAIVSMSLLYVEEYMIMSLLAILLLHEAKWSLYPKIRKLTFSDYFSLISGILQSFQRGKKAESNKNLPI